MNIKTALVSMLFLFSASVLKGQNQAYTVKKTSFSSDRHVEFSPVFYKGGLVFTSSLGESSLVDYSGGKGVGPVSVFFVEKDAKGKWKRAKLFSKDLTTKFNDGPITFNAKGDICYYSRNMFINRNQKKNPYYRNKLGLFAANLSNKEWINMSPFRYNNDWFNITTPCLSPDGQRLYFSSDRPDGFGGADLYYCAWENGYWGEPVNLGADINTSGNETYPFVNAGGELFFSSDGHLGLGGKDIFVTKQMDGTWHIPVRLDAPINSRYDDFGIVTDAMMDSGYFSSHRDVTIDIYSFNTLDHQVWFSSPQKQNNYCVSFKDSGSINVDTLYFQHEWDFGDGIKKYGKNVKHCFAQTGIYTVDMNIVDRGTKELFFHKSTYQVEIVDIEQPFIRCKDYVRVGDVVSIDALKTYFTEHEVKKVYWQLNDTTFKQGSSITYQYPKAGEHIIKLAVVLQSKSTGEMSKRAVSKKIQVFDTDVLKDEFIHNTNSSEDASVVPTDTRKFKIKTIYSADIDAAKESVFRLQLLVSKDRVPIDSPIFRTVPSKYQIQERYNNLDSTYTYFVAEQPQLISLYPSYKNILSSGFHTAIVTYNSITEPAEIELFRINQKYGTQSDDFFNSRNTLKTNGILMLNNIVGVLHKFPDIKLQIDVHGDNVDTASRNMYLTQSLAQKIADYLASTGIKRDRLIPQGKGEEYPIRSNLLESGRKINRRVEFKIIY